MARLDLLAGRAVRPHQLGAVLDAETHGNDQKASFFRHIQSQFTYLGAAQEVLKAGLCHFQILLRGSRAVQPATMAGLDDVDDCARPPVMALCQGWGGSDAGERVHC